MENVRKAAGLIPYKIKSEKVFVYLQKRAKDAKRHPDCFGFFGGKTEANESPEETMLREIKEELNFVPKRFIHIGEYKSNTEIDNLFVMEVTDDFESKIEVMEGEYGKWFSEEEILKESKISDSNRLILKNFYEFFKVKIISK